MNVSHKDHLLESSHCDRLQKALQETAEQYTFKPILEGFRALLESIGIFADRIQLPMTKMLGFRHPTYWGVIVTWYREGGFEGTDYITHAQVDQSASRQKKQGDQSGDGEPKTSYADLLHRESWYLQEDLERPQKEFKNFELLRSKGLRYYFVFQIPLPGSEIPAVMSLAARAPFPEDLPDQIEQLRSLFGLCLFGAYRFSQAHKIATTYVGPRTGPRVLEGAVSRGASEFIEAGVMFCDIRGFTALSERVGAGIIPIMNQLFEVIEAEAAAVGGEILKFIGDAVLIVYPLEARAPEEVAQAMVVTVKKALERIQAISLQLGEPLSAGFGCHIGEVIYGNIGTSQRLDFTVMGPAVNLTSRLESLCKGLQCEAVFSQEVARHLPNLRAAGEHRVKGVSRPVSVWTLPTTEERGAESPRESAIS